MPTKMITRDEAIRRCIRANPNLSFGMFAYHGYDCETVFKCTKCKTRFYQRIESVWRGERTKCRCGTCDRSE